MGRDQHNDEPGIGETPLETGSSEPTESPTGSGSGRDEVGGTDLSGPNGQGEAQEETFPDPQQILTAIKQKLKAGCSVRDSKFVDLILSRRLNGCTFREIEEELTAKGLEYRIPASTIWRNMTEAGAGGTDFEWTALIDMWGGEKEIDIQGELKNQAFMQKYRINALVKREREKKKLTPEYMDRRIREEMETLVLMLKTLHETGVESVDDTKAAKLGKGMEIDSEAEQQLEAMILSGKLRPTQSNTETMH